MATTKIPAEFLANNTIVSLSIAENIISTRELAANGITSAQIASNAVLTRHIDDNQITGAQIADNAVGTDQLAGIARGKIIVGDASGNPALLSLGSNGYVLKSDGSDIAWAADADTAALTTEQVQDIAGAMFSSNTETGIAATYQDGDGTIDLVIGDDVIVQSMIADNAIDSQHYVDGSIDTAHIADNQITAAKLNLPDDSGRGGQAIISDGDGSFSYGNVGLTTEQVQDIAGGMFSSNTETGIAGTYQDGDGTIDLVLATAQPTVTSLGTLTTLTVDEMTLDADTLTATDTFTIDAAGDIFLDAGGGDIRFRDDGTQIGQLHFGSQNLSIYTSIADKDIVFLGNDGGSEVTALTLDMSAAGAAIFNSTVVSPLIDAAVVDGENFKVNGGQGSDGQILTSTGSGVAWEDAAGGGPTSKTFGTSSIMIGDNATGSIDAANYNTGVGVDVFAALTTGDDNVAVGFGAANDLTTGVRNVFIGEEAGSIGTTTSYSVGIGRESLKNATANDNTAVGYVALKGLTSGTNNVAIGRSAMTAVVTGEYNVAVGRNAGGSITSGNYNVAIGGLSLDANNTGGGNVAIGTSSLGANTTGDGNTAVGNDALSANTTAAGNTAVGISALLANTTGSANTAVGKGSLDANTTGGSNVAVGQDALTANTTGAGNIGIGVGALRLNTTAGEVTGIGDGCLAANTTGATNTAYGAQSLSKNTTGGANTAVGGYSMQNNTTGHSNFAGGLNSLRANTTAHYNTAVGHSALTANTTGGYNTAVGQNALLAHTTGNFNTAVGRAAAGSMTSGSSMTAVGVNAGHATTTGNSNTFIGESAGLTNTTGAENTYIGDYAGRAGGINMTTGSHNVYIGNSTSGSAVGNIAEIVLGRAILGNGSKTFTVGVTYGTTYRKTLDLTSNATSFSNPSDERLKENITDSSVGLNFINDLRPITYTWKAKKDVPTDMSQYEENSTVPCSGTGKTNYGFIAQEVKTAIDNYNVADGQDIHTVDPDGTQKLSPAELVPMLVKAVQELSARITALES